LPWILLFFVLTVGLGIFWLAQKRLGEQKQKTAEALKADDEVNARLKAAVNEMLEANQKQQAAELKAKELELRVKELEGQNESMTEELEKLRKKPGKR
jgi:uncharacterized protein HemX